MNERLEAANLLRAIRAVGMERAGDLLDWALTVMPDRLAVQRLHIRALMNAGDYAAAESAIARAMLNYPEHVSLHLLRAECLVKRQRWGFADLELTAIVQRRPHHRRARYLAGIVASQVGDHSRAIHLLQSIADDETTLAALVQALVRAGRVQHACESLDRMRSPSPLLVAQVYKAQDRLLDATDTLLAALTTAEYVDDELLCMLIELLVERGDPERLQQVMNHVTPEHPLATLRVAHVLLGQGRFVRAATLAARYVRQVNYQAEALPTLIVAASMMGRSRLARRALSRLRRTVHGINATLMAQRWQQGMLGRMLRAQHDALQAGCDPGSSVLQMLLAQAREHRVVALKKNRRIEDSAGVNVEMSERTNEFVSSSVVTPCP